MLRYTKMKKLAMLLITAAIAITTLATPSGMALASTASPAMTTTTRDNDAYYWALTQRGKWYGWGGTGPTYYDCSGLVYRAYVRMGVANMPRTTYQMVSSPHLYRVRYPRKGDLAFFGTGHVEFYVGGHETFGAHHSGTQVGLAVWNAYWHPTFFMRVG